MPATRERFSEAMDRVFRWGHRPEWDKHCEQVCDLHLLGLSEDAELDLQGLSEAVGQEALEPAIACALEDLATLRFEPDDRNLVDDYLRRRGWTETPKAREYLLAVRDSVMSLYEVQEVEPGVSLTLKDLLRNVAPIVVSERMGSMQLVRWDIIAGRVVRTSDATMLTGAVLHFQRQMAQGFSEGRQAVSQAPCACDRR